MSYVIEATNLTKIFTRHASIGHLMPGFFSKRRDNKVLAVDDVSFKIYKGEIFSIIGKNGVGKTTLLKMLASLIFPTRGKVSVNGLVGLVSGAERSFYWRLTGEQNLKFFAALYGVSSSETKDRTKRLSKLLEIEDILHVLVQEYSAGAKQRLAIIRALLTDPPILLLDEPTKTLDPTISEGVRELIKTVLCQERKKTIVLTTHNASEAIYFGDRLMVMEKGRINPWDDNHAKAYGIY